MSRLTWRAETSKRSATSVVLTEPCSRRSLSIQAYALELTHGRRPFELSGLLLPRSLYDRFPAPARALDTYSSTRSGEGAVVTCMEKLENQVSNYGSNITGIVGINSISGRGRIYHWSRRNLPLVQGGVDQWSREILSVVNSSATTEEFLYVQLVQ